MAARSKLCRISYDSRKNNAIKVMSKKKWTRHNKISDVDYVVTETKRSIE